jgi:hypothetical protein
MYVNKLISDLKHCGIRHKTDNVHALLEMEGHDTALFQYI